MVVWWVLEETFRQSLELCTLRGVEWRGTDVPLHDELPSALCAQGATDSAHDKHFAGLSSPIDTVSRSKRPSRACLRARAVSASLSISRQEYRLLGLQYDHKLMHLGDPLQALKTNGTTIGLAHCSVGTAMVYDPSAPLILLALGDYHGH